MSDVCEVRFEAPSAEVSVLDGYCSATGKNRTDVMRSILRDWSSAKLREATLICRVAGINLTSAEACRSSGG